MRESTVQLPQKIDCIKFAEQQKSLSGTVVLSELRALCELVLNPDEAIEVEIQFGQDEHGYKFIKGRTKGSLSLTCQRCLTPLSVSADSVFQLSPIVKPFEAEALPTHYEPIMLQEARWLETYELLAEEILLNLPYVPKHQEDCLADNDMNQIEQTVAAERKKPFADLASLLKD